MLNYQRGPFLWLYLWLVLTVVITISLMVVMDDHDDDDDGWLDVDRCRGFLRVSVDGFWCLLQCCLTQMPNLLTIPATFCCRAPWTYTLPPEIFLKDLCLIGIRPTVFFCSFSRHPKQWRLGCSRVHCLAGLLGSSEIYRSNLQKAGEVLGPMGVEAGSGEVFVVDSATYQPAQVLIEPINQRSMPLGADGTDGIFGFPRNDGSSWRALGQ